MRFQDFFGILKVRISQKILDRIQNKRRGAVRGFLVSASALVKKRTLDSRRFYCSKKDDSCSHFVFFYNELSSFPLAYYFKACKYSLYHARTSTHKHQKVASMNFFGTERKKFLRKNHDTPVMYKVFRY